VTADASSHSFRRDPTSRILEDCAILGRLVAVTGVSAASRLEKELGAELAARLVTALRARR
jgi:hypothetical protein